MDFEKKDVWNVKFAEDNPDQFVMMEKSRYKNVVYLYKYLIIKFHFILDFIL